MTKKCRTFYVLQKRQREKKSLNRGSRSLYYTPSKEEHAESQLAQKIVDASLTPFTALGKEPGDLWGAPLRRLPTELALITVLS